MTDEAAARRILADPVRRQLLHVQLVAALVTNPEAPRVIRETQEAVTRAVEDARKASS